MEPTGGPQCGTAPEAAGQMQGIPALEQSPWRALEHKLFLWPHVMIELEALKNLK